MRLVNDVAFSASVVAEVWRLKRPHRVERQDRGVVGHASSALHSQLVP